MNPTGMLRLTPFFVLVLTINLVCVSFSLGDSKDPPRDGDSVQLAAFKVVLDKNPDDYQTLKKAGILLSKLALDDPKAFAPQSIDFLTRAHELNKLDDETLCYLGSTITLMARTTKNPFKQSGFVNRGCGYMDKAVRRSPDNITVRMTRAANSMALPTFLNRRSFAFEDYEYLVKCFQNAPQLSATLKKTVYENLAELYRRTKKTAKAQHYARLAATQ